MSLSIFVAFSSALVCWYVVLLRLNYNAALTNLQALNALTTVGGTVIISSNPALVSLHGLNALVTVSALSNVAHDEAVNHRPP